MRIPPLLRPEWAWTDPHLAHPHNHFYIVSITALVALGISIVVGVVGLRQRNLQVVYVSLAFISLAGFFSAHGLATPGFILERNSVVGVASQLAVMTTSFWLLVSSLPVTQPLSIWLSKRAGLLLFFYTLLILILLVLGLGRPMLAEAVPVNSAPLKYVAGLLTAVMAAVAGYRYWESYRYTRFPFQLAIAYTGGWILGAQIIITTSETFYFSWWIYHFLLLFAVISVVVGLLDQYRRQDSFVRSVVGLFSEDPRERLAAGIPASVRQLIETVEARDPYTAGHSYRVAQGAFEFGAALKLPPEELRILVQGAVMHDIGKMQVPDDVLNKTGPLTLEERRLIEKHPIFGYELCARLGLMPPELAIVRSHHERLDGRGYPDGLSRTQIPLLVRLLSVIDVWDALTSARAYRPAWSQDEALEYLRQNSGSQFDPELVEAWLAFAAPKKKKD